MPPAPAAESPTTLWRLVGIRLEERRTTMVAFVALFVTMAGHGLLETARDAIFLARHPAARLPWAYLAIAALAGLAVHANRFFSARFVRRSLLSLSLSVAATVTAGLWVLLRFDGGATPYVLYVWTGLAATLLVVQIWLLLGEAVDAGPAQRVFPVIGAGAILGAAAGSALAAALLTRTHARELVLFAAALFLLGAVVPFFMPMPGAQPALRHSRRGSFRRVRAHPYLRRLLLFALISMCTLTIADYLFKSVVSARIAPENLGVFFGRFYAAANGLALVLQLLVARRLLRTRGAAQTLLVLPTLIIAFALGAVAAPGLLAVIALRGADGALRHSLHRTGVEVLHTALPADLRAAVKVVIDGVGQRGGQALASLAILGATAVGAQPVALAAAVAVLAVVWIAVVASLRRPPLFEVLARGSRRRVW